ncbi:MAG: SRPBCC domain-containing protein [Bacteroidota bacterium]|nr:SRPBCC domain-containing protein [Bacteroidota bacterium]
MPSLIQKSITITATPHHVWRVFTDEAVTKQLGGHYVSNWQVGNSLGWKAEDGKIYTHGIILELFPDQILKHNLVDLKTKERVTSVITYTFEDKETYMILHAKEELAFDMREEQFEEALEGWDMALESVKEIAEKLYKKEK